MEDAATFSRHSDAISVSPLLIVVLYMRYCVIGSFCVSAAMEKKVDFAASRSFRFSAHSNSFLYPSLFACNKTDLGHRSHLSSFALLLGPEFWKAGLKARRHHFSASTYCAWLKLDSTFFHINLLAVSHAAGIQTRTSELTACAAKPASALTASSNLDKAPRALSMVPSKSRWLVAIDIRLTTTLSIHLL